MFYAKNLWLIKKLNGPFCSKKFWRCSELLACCVTICNEPLVINSSPWNTFLTKKVWPQHIIWCWHLGTHQRKRRLRTHSPVKVSTEAKRRRLCAAWCLPKRSDATLVAWLSTRAVFFSACNSTEKVCFEPSRLRWQKSVSSSVDYVDSFHEQRQISYLLATMFCNALLFASITSLHGTP